MHVIKMLNERHFSSVKTNKQHKFVTIYSFFRFLLINLHLVNNLLISKKRKNEKSLAEYPDVLDVYQAAAITGVAIKTVTTRAKKPL